MTDTLQKFLFENAVVRGELVEISETWRQMQARHDYPKAVQTLLGEMVAAAALMSANLKFNKRSTEESRIMTDTLPKFLFENAVVRGELVEISETWRQMQAPGLGNFAQL